MSEDVPRTIGTGRRTGSHRSSRGAQSRAGDTHRWQGSQRTGVSAAREDRTRRGSLGGPEKGRRDVCRHVSQDFPVRSQKWDVCRHVSEDVRAWRRPTRHQSSVLAVAGPGRDDPSSGLPGDRCNEVEVMVVVQDRRVMLSSCCGDD